jgi:hypothetical protein
MLGRSMYILLANHVLKLVFIVGVYSFGGDIGPVLAAAHDSALDLSNVND